MRGLLSGIGLFIAAGCGDPTGEVQLFSECPSGVPGCVQMTLDTSVLDSILLSREEEEGDGWSVFRLSVPGRLNGSGEAEILLNLPAFTGGMECSAFGQASVAVTGFTSLREPLLLTSEGDFIPTDGRLIIGCPECAELISPDSEERIPAGVLPGWDLRLVGSSLEGVGYRDDGTLLVSQRDRCLAIPLVGPIAEVESASCVPPTVLGDFLNPVGDWQLQPGEWLLTGRERAHLLWLRSGACT